jgi:hypothetical protein
MKKLALIVIAVLGLSMVVVAQAPAKSTGIPPAKSQALKARQQSAPGMTRAEYRALMLRSEGLNRKYGIDQVSGVRFLARDLPTPVPVTVAPSSSADFQWGHLGIGIAGLLGFVAIVAGVVGFRRRALDLRTS